MSQFFTKSVLSLALLIGSATTAFGADVFQQAVSLIEGQPRAVNEARYIVLSEAIDMGKAGTIDAAFTQAFGEAQKGRNGVKVWEIANPKGDSSTAETVTLTCGVEDGKIRISVDGRVPDVSTTPTRQSVRSVAPVSVQFKAAPRMRTTLAKPEPSGRLLLRPGSSDR